MSAHPQRPRQNQRNPRLRSNRLGPADDLRYFLAIGRLGRGEVSLPFAFGEGRARLAVARQRGMIGDRGAVAREVQMVHRRRDRRGGIARQCLAVERGDPFRRPAQQRGEGLLLSEPADRRDLQVRLAEIIARFETELDETVGKIGFEQFAAPQAAPLLTSILFSTPAMI